MGDNKLTFLGTTIADRTKRATLIKRVTQILEAERGNFLHFYQKGDEIILRNGRQEKTGDDLEQVVFLGSSVIDKSNRATIIRIAAKKLQIQPKDRIRYLRDVDGEIVIRKSVDKGGDIFFEALVSALKEGIEGMSRREIQNRLYLNAKLRSLGLLEEEREKLLENIESVADFLYSYMEIKSELKNNPDKDLSIFDGVQFTIDNYKEQLEKIRKKLE